jgi:hypothetical protein
VGLGHTRWATHGPRLLVPVRDRHRGRCAAGGE